MVYQRALPDMPVVPLPFMAWQLPQALQPLQAPQAAQFPPQGLLPAFRSRTMLRISKPTINTRAAINAIFTRLTDNQFNMRSLPY